MTRWRAWLTPAQYSTIKMLFLSRDPCSPLKNQNNKNKRWTKHKASTSTSHSDWNTAAWCVNVLHTPRRFFWRSGELKVKHYGGQQKQIKVWQRFDEVMWKILIHGRLSHPHFGFIHSSLKVWGSLICSALTAMISFKTSFVKNSAGMLEEHAQSKNISKNVQENILDGFDSFNLQWIGSLWIVQYAAIITEVEGLKIA